MTTSTTENETAQATAAAAEGPEPPKKAHTAARKPRVAPSKPKAARKTTSAKKGANAPATMFPKNEPGLQRLPENFTGAKRLMAAPCSLAARPQEQSHHRRTR
jgi:hypothetical protein